MADINEMQAAGMQPEECTHNCSTCGCSCGDGNSDGESKLEKVLMAVSEIDEADLLKALQEIVED